MGKKSDKRKKRVFLLTGSIILGMCISTAGVYASESGNKASIGELLGNTLKSMVEEALETESETETAEVETAGSGTATETDAADKAGSGT
ncbi:MAG: hypothetical protein LUF27_10650, partial [Lachnospiraceae bacterium]|nr:hypothetical protein [Lachnospiraceae bacterium]